MSHDVQIKTINISILWPIVVRDSRLAQSLQMGSYESATSENGTGADTESREAPMANKQLFASLRGKLWPRPDTVNHEGAPAYKH